MSLLPVRLLDPITPNITKTISDILEMEIDQEHDLSLSAFLLSTFPLSVFSASSIRAISLLIASRSSNSLYSTGFPAFCRSDILFSTPPFSALNTLLSNTFSILNIRVCGSLQVMHENRDAAK